MLAINNLITDLEAENSLLTDLPLPASLETLTAYSTAFLERQVLRFEEGVDRLLGDTICRIEADSDEATSLMARNDLPFTKKASLKIKLQKVGKFKVVVTHILTEAKLKVYRRCVVDLVERLERARRGYSEPMVKCELQLRLENLLMITPSLEDLLEFFQKLVSDASHSILRASRQRGLPKEKLNTLKTVLAEDPICKGATQRLMLDVQLCYE